MVANLILLALLLDYLIKEEACIMKYINASTILPDELVEELQKYVQAGYIYIPAKTSSIRTGANCPAIGRNLRDAMR